ncbi:cytosine deaminase [Bradyrhizobium japonicum]|uniref:Cytosine deaminase n=1 Tax=Bradyrhizobium japonicum TaxID=375 RepID=A0A0A3XSU7_BRAJP|nr:amidohydrolase family protein [Bradyrhizobium japonicum]KGT76374.1 cytosine deaminase [Bradyrhizobium japonicum]MCS3897155.1 cytosine deaminase [Bradyrhizobium japonicum USDA 38]MCS3949670.1 cytosine deaminase [Bradyrhizobium japonicum]MCW2217647.1 cytosine deaminase [Bradyrhizobium japonicum]MCW2342262.1 cytosine deaminase [Bradyrhizobium japonicum]
MAFDMIFLNARLDGAARHHIAVADGRIAAITSVDERPAANETIDLGNVLVVPGFVEGHIHLDTSFYGDAWRPHKPCTNGFDVHERVAFQAQNMAVSAPMDVRARNQLDLCIGHGTTQMRSHVMVDGSVGLKSLETILRVREEYKGLIDIQLVAFPQSGILMSPGTPQLLDEAIGLGADLVGGLDPASFDRDIEKHLDVVFGVAGKHGVDVDIHLHDMGTLGAFEIEQIAARTRALGMEGRVAVSHAYGLGDISMDQLKRIADTLARSGVAIMTNAPGARPFPPIMLLRNAGVTVFSGNDNIRDSWWPYGDGDMLRRATTLGYRSGFNIDEELRIAFDVVSVSGARALRLEGYGLRVGAKADFVTLNAEHIPEAVVGVPQGRSVYKEGKLVACDGKIVGKRG